MAANLALTFAGVRRESRAGRRGHAQTPHPQDLQRQRLGQRPGPVQSPGRRGQKARYLPHGIANLHFIPAGPIPPNPVELLASNRFEKLMRYLEKYDRIVIVDRPTRGLPTCWCCRGKWAAWCWSRAGGSHTRRGAPFQEKHAERARTILGCIINKVNVTKRYGYRSYYRYYAYNYDYGDGEKKKIKHKHKKSPAKNEAVHET